MLLIVAGKSHHKGWRAVDCVHQTLRGAFFSNIAVCVALFPAAPVFLAVLFPDHFSGEVHLHAFAKRMALRKNLRDIEYRIQQGRDSLEVPPN